MIRPTNPRGNREDVSRDIPVDKPGLDIASPQFSGGESQNNKEDR